MAGHRAGTYTDIRIDIAEIKMDMAAIKTHLGIKEVQSAQHEGRQTQGDALTGAAGPLEAQDERRRA